MYLVKPSTQIESEVKGSEILARIERAGRTCYKSEYKITRSSAKKFVETIINLGHESVLEHESITVRFICDRGISHEIVRHRIGSYSQESTRYCNYSNKGIRFIIPPWVDISAGEYPFAHNVAPTFKNELDKCWFNAMAEAERNYDLLLEWGSAPQCARSVLPNSLKTEIVVTYNLREWRHFFKLRCAKAAHPQMRELTIPLLLKMKKLIPVVFDDITALPG